MLNSKKKIGVLQVIDYLTTGGAQQLVLTLMEGIDRKHFNPVVCTLFSGQAEEPELIADEIEALGIRVEHLAMTRWRDRNTINRFLQLIDEENIDIIHGHMLPADFWGCFLSKVFRNVKTVYTKHTLTQFSTTTYKWQQYLLNTLLANKVIAISETCKDHLVNDCFVSPEKIKRIYNPVDVERFHPDIDGNIIRKEFGISKDTIIVGNTSRFEDRKGYSYFIDVASEVTKKHSNVKFMAVGYGAEFEKMKAQIDKLNLEKAFILSKPRRDIPLILGAMDIYLFPTLWGEGFGISLAEAMATGKAIAASNVGPVPELIENEISGLIPTPSKKVNNTKYLNIESLVDAVNRLVVDKELRDKLGSSARSRVVELFSSMNFVKQTEELYFDMIK